MKRIPLISNFLLAAVAVALGACSGGAATTSNGNAAAVAQAASYAGPAPATPDVQSFKVNLWQNINTPDRCGKCHIVGGQSPMFARPDDVNQAYSAALTVVNLQEPNQSTMVIKVGGGHNCWLSTPQDCADILTTWIKNWAGGAASGTTQIQLVAPTDVTVGSSKSFPANATDNGNASFANTIYPLLSTFCSRCHSESAAVPQSPYFASSNVQEAYQNAQAKIDLDTPTLSRFYVRLNSESHNCWVPPGGTAVSCPQSAAAMLAAIQAFANGVPLTQVNPALVVSKAMMLTDGIVASGNNRYDTGEIAKWMFKEGTGTIANDTSGVDPALNLTLAGDYSWVGGWGVAFGPNGGEARGGAASSKIYNAIKSSGEFSVELWAAPANVTQKMAYMASYSGGTTERNFTVGQQVSQYEMFTRSSGTDANGSPALLTNVNNLDAQASLQHIVMTYDPLNGRRLYINGVFTGDVDTVKGGTLGNWDNTFVFMLGNETSDTRPWQGAIRFAAVFDHALTADQIQQNFAAGVGQSYFLLFDVSTLTGMNESYVMFTVSQYDSYSYLFNKPVFISLDPTAQPGSIPIKGMRIGINGAEAIVGQAYATLNTTITNANYSSATGQSLSSVGTVIALEKGPTSDQFFLTFDQIGSSTYARTPPATPTVAVPPDSPQAPDYGMREFAELNASMAKITGIPASNPEVAATYALVEQQLPTVNNIQSFLGANQIGIAQLAISYCDALVQSNQASSYFAGLDFTQPPATAFADTTPLINPLLVNGIGVNLATQPASADVTTELNNLISGSSVYAGLLNCSASDPTCVATPARTKTIAKAACAAVLGSASLLIK